MYFAANIKNNPIIKDNKSALNYFNNNATVFIVLTVLSGGVYASLGIVSSMIFGLALFNTGLTKFELNKLTKIKLISTVCCENLPQLLLQILYFAQFGFLGNSNATDAAVLAFVGSILSVILSVLVWYVNKKEEGILPVIYYVEFGKKKRIKLNPNEKELLSNKTFFRKTFSIPLCQNVLNISPTVIQISYISVIDCGILIRFIHFVDNKDLITMQRSLKNYNSKTDHFNEYNDMFTGLSPKFYTKKLFKQYKHDMLSHYFEFFELDTVTSINLYDIKYYDEIPTHIDTTNNNIVTKLDQSIKNQNLNSTSTTEMTEINHVMNTLKQEVKALKEDRKKMKKKFENFMYSIFDQSDSDSERKQKLIKNNNDSSVHDGFQDTNIIPSNISTNNDEMKYSDDSDDMPPRGNVGQILGQTGPNLELRKKSHHL